MDGRGADDVIAGAVEASVIIPAHNAADVLGEQLRSLARQRGSVGNWEVIVVDDCSNDGTAAVARNHADVLPELRVVTTDRSRNAAKARNTGVAAAHGRLLLFTDADDVVGDGWLAEMVAALEADHLVAGPLDVERLNVPWVRASRPVTQQYGLQVWDVGGTTWLPHAGGPSLGVSRHLWEAVGPFDVELDFVDDIDLCFRAQLAGYELRFVPHAVVHYRLRDSLGGIYRQARDWGEGSVRLQRKFIPRGMPRPSRLRNLLGWGWVPLELLTARDRGDLARWFHRLGWRVGRLRGALRRRW
jgi:glycosyltransferase involved in cell wall biosynthesis